VPTRPSAKVIFLVGWGGVRLSHLGKSDTIWPTVGRTVSKQVTSGSQTAVMEVISFLCVSLGSSTVQLHDSLGTRHACAFTEAGFSSQNDDRA
jgi:hypothetical protein